MAKKSEGFKVFTCVTSSMSVPVAVVDRFLKNMRCTQKSTDVSPLVKRCYQELFQELFSFNLSASTDSKSSDLKTQPSRSVERWNEVVVWVWTKHPKYTQ